MCARGWRGQMRVVVGLAVWSVLASAAPAFAAGHDEGVAVLLWGAPDYTDGDANSYPQPDWIQAAARQGGEWISGDGWYGWQPDRDAEPRALAANRLLIHLDRARSPGDIRIVVDGVVASNCVLLAGLCGRDLQPVAEPVVLGRIAAPPGLAPMDTALFAHSLELSKTPTADVIAIFATGGLARIFHTVLIAGGCPALDSREPVAATAAAPDKEEGVASALSFLPTAQPGLAAAPTENPPVASLVAAREPAATAVVATGHRTWHVDEQNGSDGNDGDVSRPKKTLAATLALAGRGDCVVVAAGRYPEAIKLDGVRLITTGRVTLQ